MNNDGKATPNAAAATQPLAKVEPRLYPWHQLVRIRNAVVVAQKQVIPDLADEVTLLVFVGTPSFALGRDWGLAAAQATYSQI
ncbi:hypothetical protein HJFPF1_04117 [Paramyrothecium foliicola]|nr:hypothetical protein HJFPF1_04117 [Paramyrothecium foliicola]